MNLIVKAILGLTIVQGKYLSIQNSIEALRNDLNPQLKPIIVNVNSLNRKELKKRPLMTSDVFRSF